MIRLLAKGTYKLLETKTQIKILVLDDYKNLAWVNAGGIGEILVSTYKKHKADHVLSVGNYRLYNVKKEPKLTDLKHIELHTGNCLWQGYLLPRGLPDNKNKRKRIIPTTEVITCACNYNGFDS